ncbi:MAG: hypothetical protein ACKN9T_11255 [Candidatus Methylumidiphilus sp.]
MNYGDTRLQHAHRKLMWRDRTLMARTAIAGAETGKTMGGRAKFILKPSAQALAKCARRTVG